VIRKLKLRTDSSQEEVDGKVCLTVGTYCSLGAKQTTELGFGDDTELLTLFLEKTNAEQIVDYLYGDILKSLEAIKKKASQGLIVARDVDTLIQEIIKS
jgi:hypothetical protein